MQILLCDIYHLQVKPDSDFKWSSMNKPINIGKGHHLENIVKIFYKEVLVLDLTQAHSCTKECVQKSWYIGSH